jgi:hypothetical protein
VAASNFDMLYVHCSNPGPNVINIYRRKCVAKKKYISVDYLIIHNFVRETIESRNCVKTSLELATLAPCFRHCQINLKLTFNYLKSPEHMICVYSCAYLLVWNVLLSNVLMDIKIIDRFPRGGNCEA